MLIRNLGHNVILTSALVIYGLRLGLFSLTSSPLVASFALEWLKPASTSLLLISAMTFVKDSAPMGVAASLEGVFGAAYFGLGRGLGGLLGAWAWEFFGVVDTFRLFSLAAFGVAGIYLIVVVAARVVQRARSSVINPV